MAEKREYRILFVCLGNICRSPSAEGIMRKKVAQLGIADEFVIDSAGTYGGHAGALPDARMRKHAIKRGYDLVSRSRKFYPSADFSDFDLIVCMDDQNVANVLTLAETQEERKKVVKMTDYADKYRNYNEVPDPYYGGEDGFELVLDILEDSIDGLIKKIRE